MTRACDLGGWGVSTLPVPEDPEWDWYDVPDEASDVREEFDEVCP